MLTFLTVYSIFTTLVILIAGYAIHKEDQERKWGTKKEKILKASEIENAKLQEEKNYIQTCSERDYREFSKRYISGEDPRYMIYDYTSEGRKLISLLKKSSEYCENYLNIFRHNGWFVKIDMSRRDRDIFIDVKSTPFEEEVEK